MQSLRQKASNPSSVAALASARVITSVVCSIVCSLGIKLMIENLTSAKLPSLPDQISLLFTVNTLVCVLCLHREVNVNTHCKLVLPLSPQNECKRKSLSTFIKIIIILVYLL